MANKTLFQSVHSNSANTVNEAGGIAYKKSDKAALATLACTGTFNNVYYASGEQVLDKIKELIKNVDDKFIAKLAVYARKSAFMKDTSAFLVAVLAARQSQYFPETFEKVIDNGKMLRNFVQIGRSGQAGKVINMSASRVRKAINKWFNSKSPEYIFNNSIGNNPTFGQIIRMSRPFPENDTKSALFAYLRGTRIEDIEGVPYYLTRDKDGGIMYKTPVSSLPKVILDLENIKQNYKKSVDTEIPNVDFRLLDAVLDKNDMRKVWEKQINGGWHMLRMNINNFIKYGVFENKDNIKIVAERIRNREEIKKSKVFPYQIMTSYLNSSGPFEIKEALQDALEIAVENVPDLGKGYVLVDTSGSMQHPITGVSGKTTVTKCVDVAALIASSIIRTNKDSVVIPFDTAVRDVKINPRDSVITNATKLSLHGGGTDISCGLSHLNRQNAIGDYVIIVSDNESWVSINTQRGYRRTDSYAEWLKFKSRNPMAKLICIDIQPYTTSQFPKKEDLLLVAGWSDECFNVINDFINSKSSDFWVEKIEKVSIL